MTFQNYGHLFSHSKIKGCEPPKPQTKKGQQTQWFVDLLNGRNDRI